MTVPLVYPKTLESVPAELKTDSYHMVWKYETPKGRKSETKVCKVALQVGERNASSTNPDTWKPLEDAVKAYGTGKYHGVARVVTPPYIGLDWDDCRDPETGEVGPGVAAEVERIGGYIEVSPSGTGLKQWIKGEIPHAFKKAGLEIYNGGRYFTLTGEVYGQAPEIIPDRTAEVKSLISREFPESEKPKKPLQITPGGGDELDDLLAEWSVPAAEAAPDSSAEKKYAITCPWLHEHSDGDDSGTFVGEYPSGAKFFHCHHAHCEGRDFKAFAHAVMPPSSKVSITMNGHHKADKPKPQVIINGRHLNEVTTDAMNAVLGANDPPQIFVRTGAMARVVLDEDEVPEIQRLSEAALRGRMDRVAEFVRVNKDKESESVVPANPPKIMVEDAMALGRWELPPIEAIVETPILRPDGTIFEEEGYDQQTRLYYHPAPGFEMPEVSEHPSQAEVDQALAAISEAIGEFPFADEASAANARGMLLTPIIRQAVQGCVPLALIDKPQMGTGGSLFAEVASYIGIGRHAEMLGQPAHEDEWRKQITAKLDAGASMVTIDNVDDPLTSSNLSRALTARTWTDRRLGRSEEITLAQRATWLATGNNIELGGDIARRCYWVRMDAKQSKPWEREGFKHPNLMAWVESHRGELVHALLTIARSWYAAGCPKDESLPRLGSFEGWAETVGGMLAHAGISGFLSNLDELYESADSETEEWTGFLETWQSQLGDKSLTAKALAEEWILKDGEFKTALPADLATALDNGTANFSRALGNALKKIAGRRHGERGLYVHKHGTYRHAVKWKVSESRPPGCESGESGESPQPQRGLKPKEEARYSGGNESAVGEKDSRNSPDSHSPASLTATSEDGAISLKELNQRRELGEASPVAELFANPPDWLKNQATIYRRNPTERMLKPLCAAITHELGADAGEIRPEVERELGSPA
jgi:hypothetical protein